MSIESPHDALLDGAREQGIRVADHTPPESRYVTVDGLRLHHLDWGTPGNPSMVLLHGRAVTAHSWDYFSLTMRGRYHVRALDHRGHGESAWAPDGDYSRERLAADLNGVLDALDVDSTVLVGHSMGGFAALLAAQARPERVRALVVVDSTLTPSHRPSAVQRFVEGPDTFPSLEALAEHATRFNPRRRTARLLWSLRHNTTELPSGEWTWKYDPALRDPSRRPAPPDFGALWRALETLPCPILVVRAGERSHITDEAAARLEGLAPRVRLATVPKAGHSVMGDNPLGFGAVVAGFLVATGIDPAAGPRSQPVG